MNPEGFEPPITWTQTKHVAKLHYGFNNWCMDLKPMNNRYTHHNIFGEFPSNIKYLIAIS